MANSYLTRAASGGNQKTYTISVWCKFGNLHSSSTNNTANRVIIGSDISADAENHATLSFYNDGNLRFYGSKPILINEVDAIRRKNLGEHGATKESTVESMKQLYNCYK